MVDYVLETTDLGFRRFGTPYRSSQSRFHPGYLRVVSFVPGLLRQLPDQLGILGLQLFYTGHPLSFRTGLAWGSRNGGAGIHGPTQFHRLTDGQITVAHVLQQAGIDHGLSLQVRGLDIQFS